MASDLSTDLPYLRGLGLADTRLAPTTALWSSEASVGEQDPTPGEAVPQQTTSRMLLRPSGTQSAAGALTIQTLTAGHPRPGQGGFGFTKGGVTYGHDVPNSISFYEAIEITDGGAGYARRAALYPDAVGLDNDAAVVVVHARDVVASVTSYKVSAYVRSTAGAWASAVTLYTTNTAPPTSPSTMHFHPCVADLGDGVVICAHWVYDTVNNEANIRVHRSTDSGATWAALSRWALESSIDVSTYTPGKMRMANKGDQVVIMAAIKKPGATTYADQIGQFASDSRGRFFEKIEFYNNSEAAVFGFGGVVTVDAGFMVAYWQSIGAASTLYVRTLGTAASPFSEAEDVDTGQGPGNFATYTTGPISILSSDVDVVVDDSGAVFAYVRDAGSNEGTLIRSHDMGATWVNVGKNNGRTYGTWWNSLVTTAAPVNYAAMVTHGRAQIVCNATLGTSSFDDSLFSLHLGGWSSVNLPGYVEHQRDDKRVAIGNLTWAPWELPENCSWTKTGAAATTLEADKMDITSSSNPGHYAPTTAPSGTVSEGITVLVAFRVTSGGSQTIAQAGIRLTLDDNVKDYQVTIRANGSGFTLYDNLGTPATLATVAQNMGAPVWFLVSMNDGNVSAWYRAGGVSDAWAWTEIVSDQSVQDGGGGVNSGANNFQFGHLVSSSSTSSDWYWASVVSDEYNGGGNTLGSGQVSPDELFPRFYGGAGRRLYVNDGVRITALSGPADEGDQFQIDAGSRFEVERLFYRYSPHRRAGWRSLAATPIAQQDIPLVYDSTLTASGQETKPPSDTVAFVITDASFRDFEIWGYTSGAWVSLFSGTTVLTTGELDRSGTTVAAGAAHTSPPNLWPGELNGGTVRLIDGTPKDVVRSIVSHTGGSFMASGSGQQVKIEIEGALATDPTTGNNTCEVWSPHTCVVINLKGVDYAGFRLRIPAQTTATGDARATLFGVYNVAPFGFMDSRGWSEGVIPGAALSAQDDGVEVPVYQSPGRRVVSLKFGDAMDLTQFNATSAPDYIEATANAGGEPIAQRHDTLLKLSGWLRAMDNTDPVLWLPRLDYIASGSDTTQLFRWGREFMLCTLTSGLTFTHTDGRYLGTSSGARHGELVSGDGITLREIT